MVEEAVMTKECTTHHHACDCREAKFKELEAENAQQGDHIIEQERGIVGREHRIAELEQEVERLRKCYEGQVLQTTALDRELAELEQEAERLREGISNARLCDTVVQMDECLAVLLEQQ